MHSTTGAGRKPLPESGLRVLVVEDDMSLATGLKNALQPQGLQVSVVGSAEAALESIEGGRVDLLVLDIGLPGMDGFELLRRLRSTGMQLPVLVLTARDAVDDRVQGLDLGADDYLTKPFALAELTARVRALVRRFQAISGQRVVHGPLTVDLAARRAFLNGALLEMTEREWSVLEVLVRRTDKTVSKEAIGEAIAGSEEELTPRAIEVYVSRLRAKLEPAGIRIRTVRGLGYVLPEYENSGEQAR